MKKINVKHSFLSHLKNAEHYDLIEAIIATGSPSVGQYSLLTVAWDYLKKCFDEEDKYFKLSQKNELTLQIEEAEKKRNKIFRKIKQMVKLALDGKKADTVKAAETINYLLQIYKDTTYLAYTENSAYITNFLQDIATDKYKSAADLLLLKDPLDELTVANDEFKEMFRSRTNLEYQEISEKLMKARKESDLALEAAANNIESLHQVKLLENPASEDTKKLMEIINLINSHLDKAESIYARRVPSYKKTKDGDDTNDKPKPEPEKGTLLTVKTEASSDIYSETEANRLEIEIVETELLTEEFLKQVSGAKLHFSIDKKMYESSVIGFLTDFNGDINGFETGPTSDKNHYYLYPFEAAETGEAKLVKDTVLVARLKNFQSPKLTKK